MILGWSGGRPVGLWTRLRRDPLGAVCADLRVARALCVLIALTASLSGAAGASATSSVVAWGENGDGQLGNGSFPGPESCPEGGGYCSRTPVPVTGLSGVADLAGGSQGLALLSNGTVMAWGRDARGQLGDGCCENSDVPEPVPGLSGVTAVAASYGISMALLSNGTVMDWGENGNGQLGDGTYEEDTPTPVRVFMLKEVTAIAAGGSYGLALLKNGTVMTWGSGGGAKNSFIPVQVSGLSEVTAIAADGGHSLALLKNGTVMAWGENEYGELGNGTTHDSDVPVRVSGLREVVAIADGADHNLALLKSGVVMAWGENDWGQLGDGFSSGDGGTTGPEMCSLTCSTIPVPVSGVRDATAIAVGYGQSLALLANETVVGWGEDFSGQVGGGTAVPGIDVPVAVSGPSGVTSIAAGDVFSMAEIHGEAGQIAGEVTSASGVALEGVDVCAYIRDGALHGRCAQTKANGEYMISGLAGGEYTVEFSPPSESTLDYAAQYYGGKSSPSEAQPVPVTAADTTSEVDAKLEVGGQIRGEVTSAVGARKLAEIEVCASEADGVGFGERCALTNANGEYAISGLASGSYQVEFSASNKGTSSYITQYYKGMYSHSEATSVTVAAGQLTSGVDAEMEEPVHLIGQGIAGQVTSASTKHGIKGIEVCAYEVGGERREGVFGECVEANGLGEYAISGLPSGEYIVEFLSPFGSGLNYVTGYYKESATIADATPVSVSVSAGSADTGIDAQLGEGGRIAGVVTDASTNAAIKEVLVCALRSTTESVGCALTNASGEYTISGLPGGSYEVGFDAGKAYVVQYYDNELSFPAAQAVVVTLGDTTAPIDAAMGTSALVPPVDIVPPVIVAPLASTIATTATSSLPAASTTPTTANPASSPLPIVTIVGSRIVVSRHSASVRLTCSRDMSGNC
jgi:alpha-tubulin suppressor-like RCC1 family protein